MYSAVYPNIYIYKFCPYFVHSIKRWLSYNTDIRDLSWWWSSSFLSIKYLASDMLFIVIVILLFYFDSRFNEGPTLRGKAGNNTHKIYHQKHYKKKEGKKSPISKGSSILLVPVDKVRVWCASSYSFMPIQLPRKILAK